MSKVTRPALRYFGGKWRLAPWIISHFPPHKIYVEPFGGGASVLLRKKPSYAEIYNDLDDEIVNLFRVLRDSYKSRKLIRQLRLTPFSRIEYSNAYRNSPDPVEQARRTIIKSLMGYASKMIDISGFRSNVKRLYKTPTHDFKNYPNILPAIINRLKYVTIENRNALDLIPIHDSKETLFYIDPPYVLSAVNTTRYYNHTLSDTDHINLAQALKSVQGYVIISGYNCPLYQDIYSDWQRYDKKTKNNTRKLRTESIWLSPNTTSKTKQMSMMI